MRYFVSTVIVLFLSAAAMASPISLSDPDYAILFGVPEADLLAGPSGTAQWGFWIENNSSLWLSVNLFTFQSAQAGPGVGDFSDSSSSYGVFPLAPGAAGTSGIWGSFLVDPAAILGTVIVGDLIVNYSLFDGEPGGDGVTEMPRDSLTIGLGSVTVTDTGIPEPSTAALLGAGGLLLWLRRRTARR